MKNIPFNHQKYWGKQNTSFLKVDTEEFYERKVEEHVQCMTNTEKILKIVDLGCGAGELLFYYEKKVYIYEAIDFSKTLLGKAKQRCSRSKIKFIYNDFLTYVKSSEAEIWIASESVNQYLVSTELETLVYYFKNSIFSQSMFLYDTVDPDKRFLLEEGRTLYDRFTPKRKIILKNALKKLWMGLNKSYLNEMESYGIAGYGYRPHFWFNMAKKFDLDIELVSSKFYEYRYHVIIRKK